MSSSTGGPETPMCAPRSAQTPHKSASAALRTPMRTPGEQTSHTPVINFEAIEAQKENVQPLLKGRSAHALNTALSQRQATLKAQRKEFESLVSSEENAESDDPLEAWSRYVKWCVDSYPSGQTNESELVLVLERCTRLFKDSPQYRTDSRYLRLWILYARNVDCPSDIYNFLLANEIGTSLASLYEELAVVYEGLSSFEKADETYRMGISRSAQPLDRLKRRLTEFQMRILSREGHSSHDSGAYKAALKQAMAKAQRAMLGSKVGSTSMSANTLRGFGSQGGLEGVRVRETRNGAKPSVFKDSDGQDLFARPAVKAGWSEAATQASRKNETGIEAKKWKGEVLPQRETTTPKKPAISVYRDSDEEDEGDAPVKAKVADVFATQSASKEPSETDRLRRNPLMRYEQKLQAQPTKRPAASSTLRNKTKAVASTSSRKENYALPLRLLYPGINLEDAGQKRPRNERSGEVSMEELVAIKRGYQTSGHSDPWAHLDKLQGRWLPEPKRAKEKTVRRDPTVTAFTKDAQDQVLEMFNGGMVDSDDDSSDEQSDSEEEDEHVAPMAMLKENPAVPPTPTPAPKLAHPPAAVMDTPVRKPFGERKAAFGERAVSNPAPQRLALEDMGEEDQADSEEDSEEEIDYLNPPMREMAPLSPITEATECTRFTHALRTPGTSTRLYQDSTHRTTPSQSQSRRGSNSAGLASPSAANDAFVLSRESATQAESLTDSASESGGCGSHWAGSQLGDKGGSNSRRMSVGHSIDSEERRVEDRFDESLVIVEEFANPCCPVDAVVIDTILANLPLSVESSDDYVDRHHLQSNKLADLQRRASTLHQRASSSNGSALSSSAKEWALHVSDHTFPILQKLGEGGFGAVFLAEDARSMARSKRVLGGINGDASFANVDDLSWEEEESDDDEEGEEGKKLIAVKVETPPNRWEFYILGQLRARLAPLQLASIICARKFFCFQDESFLLLEYGEKGTLLEIVNNSVKAGVASSSAVVGQATGPVGIDEILAMFFVVEIIKIIESLHSVDLLHGDLKIDNCLLRLEDSKETWTNSYDPNGGNGWSSKGVTLIDFGRAIDLQRFKSDQRFIADWKSDVHDCLEVQTGQSWKYEIDYFGIASVAYCLLFGKYIEVVMGMDEMQSIDKPLRRYWQVELWTSLFRVCLNAGHLSRSQDLDVGEELAQVRARMESWLEENCFRAGKNLKGSLKKLEIWSIKRSS